MRGDLEQRLERHARRLCDYIGERHLRRPEALGRAGYPAAMLTDTAMFRNPHYHRPSGVPETLDYDRMARIAEALAATLSSWEEA